MTKWKEPRNMLVKCECGLEVTTAADGGGGLCCNCGEPLDIPSAEMLALNVPNLK